jgi:hypothetical protein
MIIVHNSFQLEESKVEAIATKLGWSKMVKNPGYAPNAEPGSPQSENPEFVASGVKPTDLVINHISAKVIEFQNNLIEELLK